MVILCINPGGNSLKAEFVLCHARQRYAFEGKSLLSVIIEGIGAQAHLSILDGKRSASTEPISAASYGDAATQLLEWWEQRGGESQFPESQTLGAIALRVVHGGRYFDSPVLIDPHVLERIIQLETLAPLHNKSSVEVLEPLSRHFPETPIFAVFDTAFHSSMPEHASTYAIPIDLAQSLQIRRYGFHGISHRYLLERYAHLAGTDPEHCNIVSMHLESGCSVTAIREGRSIDNSMGLTPLEGLMMGTRSGDVDPSIVALLMREKHMSVDEVMILLNKKSGLEGVSGVSLDTRILMKEYDINARVKLAMDMYAYRVRKTVGAFLAALGSVDAVVFGGGIAENGVFVRKSVCEGLKGFGLEIDDQSNERLIDVEGLLSKRESRLKAWVIPTQEGLQLANECLLAIRESKH